MRDVAQLRVFAQRVIGEHTYNDGTLLILARELLAALDVVEAAEKRIQARAAWASAPTTTTTAELDALYSKQVDALGWEDMALRDWRTGP